MWLQLHSSSVAVVSRPVHSCVLARWAKMSLLTATRCVLRPTATVAARALLQAQRIGQTDRVGGLARRWYSSGEDDKRFKVYTRTGDKGTSSLFTGERRAKDDELFHCLGGCDEVSSFVGLAREFCVESANGLADQLEEVQCLLQEVASVVATPRTSATEARIKYTKFDSDYAAAMERWIDKMDEELPPLTQFILPSGGKSAASLHVARTACRRLERQLVPLVRRGDVEEEVGKFVNRLSDFLFTAARYASMKEGKPETCYKASRGKTLTR